MNEEHHPTKYSNFVKDEIDDEIFELIEKINQLGCRTFASCQGGYDEENEYEPGFVILEKDKFENVLHLFPLDIYTEVGSGGYMIDEISSFKDIPHNNNLLYIEFNSKDL